MSVPNCPCWMVVNRQTARASGVRVPSVSTELQRRKGELVLCALIAGVRRLIISMDRNQSQRKGASFGMHACGMIDE